MLYHPSVENGWSIPDRNVNPYQDKLKPKSMVGSDRAADMTATVWLWLKLYTWITLLNLKCQVQIPCKGEWVVSEFKISTY